MAKIPVGHFHALDIIDAVKNFGTSQATGEYYRLGNNAASVQAIIGELNNAAALNPRTTFCKSQTPSGADNAGADPLFFARYDDRVANARDWRVHIIACPRIATSGTAYAFRTGYASISASMTPQTSAYCEALDPYNDVFEAEYTVARGAANACEISEGVSTADGYTVLCVTFQDEPITSLDTTLHSYASPSGVVKGGKVIESQADDIYDLLQTLRTTSMPMVVSWSAAGMTATPAAPGDATCITVTSATYVNVLDQSVTTRTAHTPGWCCDRYYAAARIGGTYNSDVNCMARVYAEASGGNGTVKFIGPEHKANNEVEITIPDGGGLLWYGDSNSTWALNSDAAYDDTTTSCNKTDVHAKVSGGGTLYIRGLAGWQTFP